MKVRKLLVEVGADTKDYDRGMKSARAKLTKLTGQIKKMGKVMAAAATAVVAAVGLMVKNYVEAGDWIDKMSKRTGIGAVALSELAYAADISGASLNDVEKCVKKMAKTITDADEGLESYLRVFRRLGLDVKKLKAMSPEEQFFTIGGAIADLEKEFLKTATAQEVFGRAGTTLLPLFKESAEEINRLRRETHELGIVFDTEAAAKAAALKDAMTKLKGAFQGISFQIADAVVPSLMIFAEAFTKTVTSIDIDGEKLTKTLLGTFKFIVRGALGVVMAFHGIKLSSEKVVEGVAGVAKGYLEGMAKVDKAIEKVWPGLAKLLKVFGTTDEAIDTLSITQETYRQKGEETIDTLSDLIMYLESLEQALDEAYDASNKVSKSITEADAALGGAAKTIETTIPTYQHSALMLSFTAKAWYAMGTAAEVSADLARRAAAALGISVIELKNIIISSLNVILAWTGLVFQKITAGASAWDIQKAKIEEFRSVLQEVSEQVMNVVGRMDAMFGQLHANEAQRIENTRRQQSDAIEAWFEERRAYIEQHILDEEAKVAALEALDEEKARKENALQHRIEKEQRKLERKRAVAQKASALAMAGINIAEAITKALTAGPIIGQVLAALVAVMGAVQIAAIASAPLPALAKGGYIEKEMVARLHPGELVLSPAHVKALASPDRMIGSFSPTVIINTKTLDDRTIRQAGEKIYAELQRQQRRFG